MRTQLEQAKLGRLTPAMRSVARVEGIEAMALLSSVAHGDVVIMRRGKRSVGIGKGLSTKVNVNIGTSPLRVDPDEEVKKAVLAERCGADTLTDLSMGGDIGAIRARIFGNTTIPITTVPIYQAAAETGLANLDEDQLIRMVKQQAGEGVNSFVLHFTDESILAKYRNGERIMGVVSKGGSMTIAWMKLKGRENPFITCLDEILAIARRHDIVLSLGNTMRSGCIHDAMDNAQKGEMHLNAGLAKRAHEAGVQAIIEGMGGHVRADRIPRYVKRYRKASNAPLFVAGPLPTDIAVGHDHIASCVGASIAAGAGADYLCSITPAEHLGLPGPEEMREGLIAARIAAHIGDSIKYGPDARDLGLARKRRDLDWEGQFRYAIDGERAREMAPGDGPCTMCGEFCAIKMMRGL